MVVKERGWRSAAVITAVVLGASLTIAAGVNGLLWMFPWVVG
jgi:hypothetical protein